MIMTESEMDEQLDIIGDFWEEQERAEDEYDARQAEIEEAYQQGAKEFAKWLASSDYANGYFDTDDGFVSVEKVLAEWQKERANE